MRAGGIDAVDRRAMTDQNTGTQQSAAAAPAALRSAILGAARLVLQRDGAAELSPERIADEIGCMPETVYEYFPTKSELLLSVAADDLSMLVDTMRDGPNHESAANSWATATPNAVAPQATSAEAAAKMSILSRPAPADADRTEPAAPAAARESRDAIRDKALRAVRKTAPLAPELDELLKELVTEEPTHTEGTAETIARLKRRLDVHERMLSEVIGRLGKIETADGDGPASTKGRIDDLDQRGAAFEKRMTDTIAELRLAASDAARRLRRLEILPLAAAPAAETVPGEVAPESAPVPQSSPESPSEPGAQSEPDAPADAPQPKARESYLAAARRAANDAAAAAVPKPDGKPAWLNSAIEPLLPAARQMDWRKHARPIAIGGGVLVLSLLTASMMFGGKNTPSSAPASQPSAAAPDGAPVEPIQATPARSPAGVAHKTFTPEPASGEDAPAAIEDGPSATEAPPTEPGTPSAAAETPGEAAPKLDDFAALALAGSPRAQLILGLKHIKGDGVPADPAEAATWLLRAAYQGEPTAQYWLGMLYARGQGVPIDPAQAIHWYEAAAQKGNAMAMNELAALYEHGAGVPRSLSDAYKWYAIASAHGDKSAKERVEALEAELSPAELAKALDGAKIFKPAAAGDAARSVSPKPKLSDN